MTKGFPHLLGFKVHIILGMTMLIILTPPELLDV